MAVAFCPGCGQGIQLGAHPYRGQRVVCNQCGARLEVINVRPLELGWGYDELAEEGDGDWEAEEEKDEEQDL